MSLEGHVENGHIVLDTPAELPEGAKVRVEVVPPPVPSPEAAPTMYEKLKPIIGILTDLPPDLSVNLDHYLYGTPKRQP